MPLLVAQRNAHGVASQDHQQLLAGINSVHYSNNKNFTLNNKINYHCNSISVRDSGGKIAGYYEPLDFAMSKAFKTSPSNQLYRQFYGNTEMSDASSLEKSDGMYRKLKI